MQASALADAGLTPYHAIKLALPRLSRAGTYALVVGLGGLGLMAVQILKDLTGATVIATDMKPEAMAEAEKYGAVTVPSGEDQVARIREITGGRGVDAAFDFVGIAATARAALDSAAVQSRVTIVGIGNGSTIDWSFLSTPYEAELVTTYWGTVEELHELAGLYRDGKVEPLYTTYAMDGALQAYRDLQDGKISGRAVVVRDHASASRRVSRPMPPRRRARVWKALRSKSAPSRASCSARICSQMRWPTLYAGACPGQPR